MNPWHTDRLAGLKPLLERHSLDLLLLFSTRSDSRFSFWATGSTCRSTWHYLMVTPEDCRFVEVSYRAHELRETSGLTVSEVQEETSFGEFFRQSLAEGSRVGIAGPAPATHFLGGSFVLTDLGAPVEELMTCKHDSEIEALTRMARDASEQVESAWREACASGDPSEFELSQRIRSALLNLGEQLAFPLTVTSGDRLRSSTVGAATGRTILPDEPCLVDFGLTAGGLTIDLTRMFFRQQTPLAASYQALREGLREAVELFIPGTTLAQLIDELNGVLKKRQLPVASLEIADLGHGIGYGLHESPFIGQESYSRTRLKEGMVLCIEPELTVDGFRIRHEEMIVVQAGGSHLLVPHR